MKKFLILLLIGLFSTIVNGADVLVYTLNCPYNSSNSAYNNYYDVTVSGIQWRSPGNQAQSGKGWCLGGKSITNTNRNIYSKTPISDNITKIEIEFGENSGSITVNSVKFNVYSTSSLAAALGNGDISTHTITYAANSTRTITVPSGKSWKGRYYSLIVNVTVSGSKNKYAALNSIKFYKDNTVITHTITYNGNTGIGSIIDAASPYTVNSSVTTKTNTFSKNGYTFDSWNTKADGTGVEFYEGQTFIITKDTVLYAQWLEDFTITDECGIFNETFNTNTGNNNYQGGNDGKWSGSGIANGDVKNDISGWVYEKGYGANMCIKIGTSSAGGYAETPSIDPNSSMELKLTFKAGSWGTDNAVLDLTATNAILSESSIDLTNSAWKEYIVYITNITDNFKIKFSTESGDKRFFLDEVCISEIMNKADIITWHTDSVIFSQEYFDDIDFDVKNIRITDKLRKTPVTTNNKEFKVLSDFSDSYCSYLDFIFSDGTYALKESIKIPYIVSSDINTSTITDTECDVVVLADNKLTASNTTHKNITVYEGGHLSVPTDKTLNANTLTLRRLNDSVSSISNNGTINLIQENGFFFDLRTDSEDWRWVALPASHKVSDIKTHNGKDINLNTETFVSIYDGEYRSTNYRGAWKDIGNDGPIDTTFNAGEGFLLGANLTGRQMRTYRFTFNKSVLNNDTTSKSVNGMRAWGCGNENLTANHKGWNMAGNPYMDYLEMDITEPIQVGKLIKDIQNGQWTGSWVKDDESVTKNQRYIVVPSKDEDDIPSGGYKSILLDDCEIKPFTSFFVQIGGNESDNYYLDFTADKRVNNAPLRERKNTIEGKELFLRLKVGNKKIGCFIANNFTDEFEPGDDLESYYTVYQLINNYKLLYSAVNDSIIENGIKIFANTGDRVELDNKTNTSDFEKINALYKGKWYNLLYNETFNIEDEKYFILQAKRRLNNIATGIYNNNTDRNINKIIIDGNVYIKRNNTMFNMFGEQVQ